MKMSIQIVQTIGSIL